MVEVKVIEAMQEYIITDTSYSKCDLCKKLFARAFDLTPVKKAHNFNNIVLCANCIDKCQLKFNIDIKELKISGSVEEWLKK